MQKAHAPIEDQEIRSRMFYLWGKLLPSNVSLENWSTKNYIRQFQQWIVDHPSNKLLGFDQFSNAAYCVGSVDAITGFVNRHGKNYRLRFSQSEFIAAKVTSQSSNFKWAFLESEPVQSGDALVISAPFAGTGNLYENFDQLLSTCTDLDVPVFLDLAYWGISSGITVDLKYDCIREIVFSLSKSIATQLRLAVRFTRAPIDDMIQINSDLGILNRAAADIGMTLMHEFPTSWLLSKYQHRQQEVCQQHGLTASKCVTLALGNKEEHAEYERNGYYRICITDEITRL